MRKSVLAVMALAMVVIVGNLIVAQNAAPRKTRRAKLPDYSKQSSTDPIFYRDVFTQGLEGERPANLGASRVVAATTGGPTGGGGGSDPGTTAGEGWSRYIAASALENEIKAVKITLDTDKDVATPIRFQGNGHKVARREFSVMAAMFGIIAEYDGDVRWKDIAPGVRDTFARSAANAKVGTIQAYNEAKLRVQDAQDLVGGGSFTAAGESERATVWPKVCDRSPLMQRIETAQQTKLQPMTANAGEFKDNKEDIVHEANIVAAIAEVLQKEGMEDAGDEDYDNFAKQMRDAAREILDAVEAGDQSRASKAAGAIGQSCTGCHEFYRA